MSEQQKQVLIGEFRTALSEHKKLCQGAVQFPELKSNDYGEFLLCKKYLKQHIFLLDENCSGRGLPVQRYIKLSKFWGFELDEKLSKLINEKSYLKSYIDT